MLQTSVNYLSLLETKRHNLVTESQGAKQIDINYGELAVHQGQLEENKRHNLVTEEQGWASIFETQRHNQVSEGINAYDAATRRQQLDINWFNANTQRFAAEQNASIGWANVAIGQQNANTQEQRMRNDFVISDKNASASISQAHTAEVNAKTRSKELEQRIWRDQADIENKQNELILRNNEYDLAKEKFKWDKATDILDFMVDWANVGANYLKSSRSLYQSVLSH